MYLVICRFTMIAFKIIWTCSILFYFQIHYIFYIFFDLSNLKKRTLVMHFRHYSILSITGIINDFRRMVITKKNQTEKNTPLKKEKKKQINYIQKDSSHLFFKIKENPFSWKFVHVIFFHMLKLYSTFKLNITCMHLSML